jgi:hypothetical protein
VIVDWPLATRDEIVAAFKLGADIASDSPLKTLRQKGIVSPGVRVLPRHGGRLAGQKVFYSSLCIDAARLARHGRLDLARSLCAAASELEQMPEAGVVAQAAVDGKLPAGMLTRLAVATSNVARSFQDELAQISDVTTGRVVSIEGDTVVIVAPDGAEWCLIRRTLPAELAERGTPMVVVTEWLGAAGALVSARPGVPVGDGIHDPSWLHTRPVVLPLLPTPKGRLDAAMAVASAVGSLAAEGLAPSAEVGAEASRLAVGELDLEQFVAGVLRRYGAPPLD